jgi:osmotically inducible protein OsmC
MIRRAEAQWKGSLKDGAGHVKTETGALDSAYSFKSRFEGGTETNPEELIAAAHAACFTMAVTAALTIAGHPPTSIHTTAALQMNKLEKGWTINRIDLETIGEVPGMDAATFEATAASAKETCPVSRVLAGAEIHMKATLKV